MAIDKDLDSTGKTILVTGSGRNIGRAISLEFAARGANVIINSGTNEAEARFAGAVTTKILKRH
jgi:3-oxoacyl-[acyl-carrier protein] reductase